METNTTSSSTATTMMKFLPRHGPIEICCENDTCSTTASESICTTGTLVGLLSPCGGGDNTGGGENGGQRQSASSSLSHFNCCSQHHHDRRKCFATKQQKRQQQKRSRRRRFVPFSSSSSLLVLLSPAILLLAMSCMIHRQAGFLLVHAQQSPNDSWSVYAPTPVPSIVTASLIPTRAPTPRPVASSPQTVPSPRPALFPIFWAFEPTQEPVEIGPEDSFPTSLPTPAPAMVPKPSPEPTVVPPVWQTHAPTAFPSSSPKTTTTSAPTPRPTPVVPATAQPTEGKVALTDMPSLPPVVPPTPSPTSEPTTPFPSRTPTKIAPTTVTPYPTISPRPTPRPSKSPMASPTTTPSSKPSRVPLPTTTPSLSPTLGIQSYDVDSVMKMTSMASKIISGIDWESATESHIKLSIQNNNRNLDPPLLDLEVKTDIQRQDFFPSQEPVELRRLLRGPPTAAVATETYNRTLQSASDPQPLQVQFVVRVRFRSEETLSFKNVSDLVGDAFNSDEERALYIERLQQTTTDGYPYLTTVDILVNGSTPIEEQEPDSSTGDDDDDDDNDSLDDSTLWIIIGAAGGGFLAIVALGFLACRRIGAQEQQKRSEAGGGDNMHNGGGTTNPTASHSTNPVKLGVSTEILVERQDDVSTLGDPVFGNGMMGDHDGGIAERDEQTASVGNDYDYSKQYLRAQGISGSLMTDNSRDRLMSADSGRSSSFTNKLGQPVAPSVFSDDASFDQQQFDDNVIATEQRFDVIVPPGKLGMVVDTPNGGCPVVHAIKTESILANRVQVGDRLVAVDSEDVTAMTAVQVSKLISLRSDQDRKLVFVRFISPEAAMMMRTHSNYSSSNGGQHYGGGAGAALADNDDDDEEEKEPNMMGP